LRFIKITKPIVSRQGNFFIVSIILFGWIGNIFYYNDWPVIAFYLFEFLLVTE